MTPARKICDLAGCGNDIETPHTVLGDPDHRYCSTECAKQAWREARRRKPAREPTTVMEQPAEDFGDSGVVRKFCDDPDCRKPVLLEWRGRNGVYHSLACLKRIERDKNMKSMTTGTAEAPENDTVTAPEKPIIAGRISTKKPAKKATAAAKKTAAKKVKAAKNGAGGRASGDAVIKALKADHGFRDGSRTAERVGLLLKHDGKTLGKFREAFAKKGLGSGADGANFLSWYAGDTVKKAVENGLVSIK